MCPEREKAGLLPGRPREDGAPASSTGEEALDEARRRRRPADVFIPRALGGTPAALDFACTSGMRAETLREAASHPEGILSDYEEYKKSFKAPGEADSTGALCAQVGLAFFPMVMEAHSGGWGKAAREVLDAVARHVSASWYGEAEVESLRIAQRLSCSLHRENSRAVLRRLQEPTLPEGCGSWSPGDVGDTWQ